MVNKLSKILYYLLTTVIVLVVLFFVISALPIPGGAKTFVVQSGSMEPAIRTGSIVVVLPQEKYQTGDVITFGPYSKSRPLTTHRIVEVTSTGYVTQGDANNATDARTVLSSNVIGRVRFSIPYFGYAVAAAQKPMGFIILIAVPALLLIWDEVKKIKNEVKKKSGQAAAPALAGDEAEEKTTSES
jgi:signal peptidase